MPISYRIFGFDDVIKSVAARAIEMNGPVFAHDT
jgi:hypothetical protein